MIYVVNKKTHKPSTKHNSFYIGRPSCLGNPFTHKAGTAAQVICATREEAIERYLPWLREQWKISKEVRDLLIKLARINSEGKDIYLICYCAPLPCHGDTLKEVIEKLTQLHFK